MSPDKVYISLKLLRLCFKNWLRVLDHLEGGGWGGGGGAPPKKRKGGRAPQKKKNFHKKKKKKRKYTSWGGGGRGGGGGELPHKSDEGAHRTNQDQYLPKISTKLELIQF